MLWGDLLYNIYMNILQQIFKEHYEELIYLFNPRKSIIENVDRMIHCGDSSFGGAMFGCEHCGNLKFVPFRCKSRFCPSCGTKYAIDRTTTMSFKLVNCIHRHCVFTIDENLRIFFYEDRSLLNCLFAAVRSTILRLFHDMNKAQQFTPGFICVLHTFGRDLKWNPHIHCLISEGGIGNSGLWRHVKHFSYIFLRNAFRTSLLNFLEDKIGNSFKSVKGKCYREYKHGFYVYAKPALSQPKDVLKYIGRYLGRPAIATSRIDNYDGDNVTFHYNRHEDNALIYETVPVLDFMERLIQHIPEKHFKMIRYYGIYARHRASDSKLIPAVPLNKRSFLLSCNKWRLSIGLTFGYDPLKCSCGNMMVLLELFHNHKRVPLEDLFRKAIEKYRRSHPNSCSHLAPFMLH